MKPIPSGQYPLPAKRPRYPVISKDNIKRVFGIEMADWEAQLGSFLRELAATTRPQAAKI